VCWTLLRQGELNGGPEAGAPREELVDKLVALDAVRSSGVEAAFRTVPRHSARSGAGVPELATDHHDQARIEAACGNGAARDRRTRECLARIEPITPTAT
jgi:hypothetical protein